MSRAPPPAAPALRHPLAPAEPVVSATAPAATRHRGYPAGRGPEPTPSPRRGAPPPVPPPSTAADAGGPGGGTGGWEAGAAARVPRAACARGHARGGVPPLRHPHGPEAPAAALSYAPARPAQSWTAPRPLSLLPGAPRVYPADADAGTLGTEGSTLPRPFPPSPRGRAAPARKGSVEGGWTPTDVTVHMVLSHATVLALCALAVQLVIRRWTKK